MAIQTVDLTVPGGDTPRSANTKINANFTNTTHAANRLIGTTTGNVPEYSSTGLSGSGYGSKSPALISYSDKTSATGFYRSTDTTNPLSPISQWTVIQRSWFFDQFVDQVCTRNTSIGFRKYARIYDTPSDTFSAWTEFYTTTNTTKEAGTGYLVASSPVLKVQHDNFERVHESEQLDIDVQHLETGVYEITGTTGLRDNDGWYLKPPKDINGNVLCICEATQEGDVITLKTYKKKFDFETVSIVPDYEQPTDIPDGAIVMLRFNDLPQAEV